MSFCQSYFQFPYITEKPLMISLKEEAERKERMSLNNPETVKIRNFALNLIRHLSEKGQSRNQSHGSSMPNIRQSLSLEAESERSATGGMSDRSSEIRRDRNRSTGSRSAENVRAEMRSSENLDQ